MSDGRYTLLCGLIIFFTYKGSWTQMFQFIGLLVMLAAVVVMVVEAVA